MDNKQLDILLDEIDAKDRKIKDGFTHIEELLHATQKNFQDVLSILTSHIEGCSHGQVDSAVADREHRPATISIL